MTPPLPQAEITRIEAEAKIAYKVHGIHHVRDLSAIESAYIAGASREAIRGRELAKQFGEWFLRNAFEESPHRWSFNKDDNHNPSVYTTAELLDLFILDTQKGKG